MYPCLPPSFRCFLPLNLVTDHHSDSGITSLLDHLTYCASWLIPSLSSNIYHSFSHLFDITCTTTLGQFNLMPVILVSMEGIRSCSLSRAQAHPHSCLLLTIPDQLLYTFSVLLIGPSALWPDPAFLFPELPFSSMPHVLCLMAATCFHPSNSFPAELFA